MKQTRMIISSSFAILLLAAVDNGPAFAQGNSPCAHWCQQSFAPGAARGQCVQLAAHGVGPCFDGRRIQ